MGEDEEGTRETDFHGGSGNQLLREQEQNEFLSIFLLAGKHLYDWPMVMSLNRVWMKLSSLAKRERMDLGWGT